MSFKRQDCQLPLYIFHDSVKYFCQEGPTFSLLFKPEKLITFTSLLADSIPKDIFWQKQKDDWSSNQLIWRTVRHRLSYSQPIYAHIFIMCSKEASWCSWSSWSEKVGTMLQKHRLDWSMIPAFSIREWCSSKESHRQSKSDCVVLNRQRHFSMSPEICRTVARGSVTEEELNGSFSLYIFPLSASNPISTHRHLNIFRDT